MKYCPVCTTEFGDEKDRCPDHGARLLETDTWAPGTLVRGKFKVLGLIGRGGMGVVYRAEHLNLAETWALKVMKPVLSRDPDFTRRFFNEAKRQRMLRHPNIVRVEDLDQLEDGTLFIAMECVEGSSLREMLQAAQAPLAVPLALRIAAGVAAALAAADALGVVHRDLKPDNILLARAEAGRMTPKLADFGLAKLREVTATLSHERVLTPKYAAPEQWEPDPRQAPDSRTDVYALGVTLYEMLAGRLPFEAENDRGLMRAHLETTPPPPSQWNPEVAAWPGLDSLVLRMLAKRVEDRPTPAALESVLASLAPAAPPAQNATLIQPPPLAATVLAPPPPVVPSPPPPAPRPVAPAPVAPLAPPPRPASPRHVALPLAGLLLVLVAAGFAVWRFTRPPATAANGTAASAAPAPQTPAASTPAGTVTPTVAPTVVPTPVEKPVKKNDTPANVAPNLPPATPPPPTARGGFDPATLQQWEQKAEAFLDQRQFGSAAPLFQRACDGGLMLACRHLGDLYQRGDGVTRSPARAVALYQQACDGHDAHGCRTLGTLYETGGGVPRDSAHAAALYQRACEGRDAVGCNALGDLYGAGSGVARDPVRAAGYYRQACDAGDAYGCTNLALMLEKGNGVPRDPAQAASLYQQACSTGAAKACAGLARLRGH